MYKTVIGLEVHVQLKTKSKMFCGCSNTNEESLSAISYQPNSRTCPVCMGLPGVLPVANRQAIEWVLKTGLALNAKIAEFSKFDRKHYFYPDLPKGYQISQFDLPFCMGGELVILSAAKNPRDPSASPQDDKKTIHLTRIHLEEDAGKLTHIADSKWPIVEGNEGLPSAISHQPGSTLVDLNRAGTPLMEIVTEPEISSAAEAKIFMQELRSILRYLDVSEADMEKGHLRCDANISIEIDGKEGTPTEIKNINSFRMLERALSYEEKRQIQEIENGKTITKETRGWDDTKGETYSQRSKETSQDYRYFPEPDLPPFECAKVFDIEKLKQEIPELPAAKRAKYEKMGLTPQDAEVLSIDQSMAEYFEKVAAGTNPKLAANWIINELKMDGLLVVAPDKLVELLTMIGDNTISGKIAKDVLVEMISTGKSASDIVAEKGIKQIGGEEELSEIVDKVIADNPNVVASIKAGKNEAIGFLVGQVMKETQGQANPNIVNKLINERLK